MSLNNLLDTEESLIDQIQEAIAYRIGEKFFETIVITLARVLNAEYTFVGEFLPDTYSIKTISLSANGVIIPNFEYNLNGTPCANVMRYEACIYPMNVQNLFPDDLLLQEMGIEGYLGVPLYNSSNNPIGVMVALFKNKIQRERESKKILEIFSGRTGAELERVQIEEKQRQTYIELEKHKQQLEELVSERTKELSQTLESLQNAQSQLLQSEKMASLGVLTSGIAHEINNPLNYISSSISGLMGLVEEINPVLIGVEELHSEADSNKIKKLVELKSKINIPEAIDDMKMLSQNIHKGTLRLSEIVKGLKIFSYPQQESFRKTDIHEILRNSLVLLSHEIKEKVILRTEFDPKIPEIECMPGKLSQVFINIIQNSIQAFQENGNIDIKTKISNYNKDKDCIEISFRDNGKGIPSDLLNRIFEPFFTTKDIGKGIGLGLSISYGIVKKHGGDILVKSEIGKYTEFTVILPIIQE